MRKIRENKRYKNVLREHGDINPKMIKYINLLKKKSDIIDILETYYIDEYNIKDRRHKKLWSIVKSINKKLSHVAIRFTAQYKNTLDKLSV